MVYEGYVSDVKKFNEMYGLPSNDKPTLPTLKRLHDLKSILSDEVGEIDEIIASYEKALEGIDYSEDEDSHKGWEDINQKMDEEVKVALLTSMADLLGDLIVYSSTESKKYGLKIDEVLKHIMESNFSKLGEDGKPIRDERGYVVKGPNYWKPEPKISEMLKEELGK